MIPYHIPTLEKPQITHQITPDNSSNRFIHSSVMELSPYIGEDFVDQLDLVKRLVPVKPGSLESTPFTFVDTIEGLGVLRSKLSRVDEFAVDLEANSYRSFQGITCLMQISTRTDDFVIDTLKLHKYIGRYLGDFFLDPTKRKVMHGASNDIMWLQRDFRIYVRNLFDTMQASRVMGLERNSLKHLLEYFCGVVANKQYQTSDWRIRPLPVEMMHYAREDTHYLLYIYDVMRRRLASPMSEINKPLAEVYIRSHKLCTAFYDKEEFTENSYKSLFGWNELGLNPEQLKVVAGLYKWRDQIARRDDESTGYVMPNKLLLALLAKMPQNPSELMSIMATHNYQNHPYLVDNPSHILKIIKDSKIKAVDRQYDPRLSGCYVATPYPNGYYVNVPVRPIYCTFPNFYNTHIIC